MTKEATVKKERDRWLIVPRAKSKWQKAPWSYFIALAGVGVMTMIIWLTNAKASIVNVPMLYLLCVQAVALLVGSRAAVLASFVAFLAFDWFFVEPRFQFTVKDPFEFVALCVFLVTAITVGQLTALFLNRAEEAHRRELAATALAKASWTVASELNRDTVLRKVLEQLTYVESIQCAAVLVKNAQKQFEIAQQVSTGDGSQEPLKLSQEAMTFVIDTHQEIGWDNSPLWHKALHNEGDTQTIYLPISSEGQTLGIFFAQLKPSKHLLEEDRQVLTTLVNHIAVVLQRDILMEAQARAQALTEANRLKTALLQMVSHDFRSPLASIKASASSMLDEEGTPVDSSTQQALLQAIEQETDRLNKIVGNILDLSKLEADAWKPHREACSITEVVGSALDSFGQAQNARIKITLDPAISDVWVDFVQMVQVFKNLLENALKYSSKEQPVELEALRGDTYVEIEVRDRGQGLPPGEEHLLFEPFFRARRHQESSLPGVGMGLAICRGLVEAHGGSLTAYNREGGGSVFQIRLPLDKMEQQ